MTTRKALFASALATLFVFPSVARGQAVDPQKAATAQTLFSNAQAAMDKKDFATACPKLEEVTRILPNGVGGLLTLAQCYEGAGRLASAWMTYVMAQAAAAQTNRAEQEKHARERVVALKPRLAQLLVTVPDAVKALPGLSIERDGIPVGAAQWATPMPVDKGKHVIVAAATGRQRWERTIDVTEDGQEISVEVVGLVEVSSGPAPIRAADTALPPPSGAPSPAEASTEGAPTWAWVVGGIGLASALAGLAMIPVEVVADNNFKAKGCNQANSSASCTSDSGTINADIAAGVILGVVGVAGLVAGIVGVTTASPKRQHVTVRVRPLASPRNAGASVSLRF